MKSLSQIGNQLRAFYGRYSTAIDMAGKFVLALVSFFWVRSTLGFNSVLSNPFVLLILAVLCMLFPLSAVPVLTMVLVTGEAFTLGIDAGAVTLGILLILLILFLRFIPEDALEISLVPMTMFFGFVPLVPICAGIRRKVSAVFSIVSGVVVYYLMATLSREAENLQKLKLSQYAKRLQLLIGGTFSPTMVVNLIALIAVFTVAYTLRRMTFNYSMVAAVPVAGLVYLMFVVFGGLVPGTRFSIPVAFIGTVGSVIAAFIFLALLRPLDYTKSERLEFEDDDYYYYVKAIPKASATAEELRKFRSKEEKDPDETAEDEAIEKPDLDNVNFEQQLEDSLKNL
jgi:hypothetical protein